MTKGIVVALSNGGEPPLEMLRHAPPADAGQVLPLLDHLTRSSPFAGPEIRASAHVLTGGVGSGAMAVSWLGRPRPLPLDTVTNEPATAFEVLSLLHDLRPKFEDGRLLQDAHQVTAEIAAAACGESSADDLTIAQALKIAWSWLARLPVQGPVQRCWSEEQAAVIEDLVTWIRPTNAAGASAIAAQLQRDATADVGWYLTWSAGGWVSFWVAFLWVFPYSRTFQAAFIFNPSVRRYLSLGIVPLLLFLVPPLRRRLLAPFREEFLGDAKLDEFEGLGFFGKGRAKRGSEPPQSVEDVLNRLDGVVVLRGEAGLGKTSALRLMAGKAPGPIVFLHARDCEAGVPEAVTRRMKGLQDTDFVRAMVHAGTLSVIIDGLNEVSAPTREIVRGFAADNRKTRIMIGTQPIEWSVPAGAEIVDMLAYTIEESEAFLLSRPVGTDPAQKVHGEAFSRAATRFLHRSIDDAPTEPEREAARQVLANPFDLAFAADLIAQGSEPTANDLIAEAFRLADEGPSNESYRAIHNRAFPLVEFGKHAVRMREEDRNWLEPGEFEAERPCLLERRLLVRRAVRESAGSVGDRELFRHDRVWDFFIVAAFHADESLMDAHFDDARFRGAYLRIAETWAPEAAKLVRDQLVVKAALRNDNSTSNEFVRRLQARLTTSGSAKEPELA